MAFLWRQSWRREIRRRSEMKTYKAENFSNMQQIAFSKVMSGSPGVGLLTSCFHSLSLQFVAWADFVSLDQHKWNLFMSFPWKISFRVHSIHSTQVFAERIYQHDIRLMLRKKSESGESSFCCIVFLIYLSNISSDVCQKIILKGEGNKKHRRRIYGARSSWLARRGSCRKHFHQAWWFAIRITVRRRKTTPRRKDSFEWNRLIFIYCEKQSSRRVFTAVESDDVEEKSSR